jgi:excisionase family DNA binding protein
MSARALPTPRLWTAEQAASYLGVRTSWVYEAAREGRVPVVRLGKHLRFLQADLDAWIAENRVERRWMELTLTEQYEVDEVFEYEVEEVFDAKGNRIGAIARLAMSKVVFVAVPLLPGQTAVDGNLGVYDTRAKAESALRDNARQPWSREERRQQPGWWWG